MRTLGAVSLLAASIALILTGPTSSGGESASRLRGPFLLVTLPSLGTVTWTCDPGARRPSFALGYIASPRYATTAVELRAGGRLIARFSVEPGMRVRFPVQSVRRQSLLFLQGTGAGELRASVAVDFVPGAPVSYCWPYAPPAVTAKVSPRR